MDFGRGADPESLLKRLLMLPDELVDVAGTLTASGMVDDDVSEALDVLVTDSTVTRKEIERNDGDTAVFYRLAE